MYVQMFTSHSSLKILTQPMQLSRSPIDILKTDKHMHNFMQIKRLKPFWFNEEVVLVQPINKTEDPFQLFLSLMIYVSSLKVSLFIPKIFKLKFCFECQ